MKRMKVAVAQIPVVMGKKEANVETIFGAVLEASRKRCDVVVLPECSLTGWLSSAARAGAEPVPGPLTECLSEAARRYRIAVVVGFEEREGARIYNSAVLIDRKGRMLARHRKINELEIGLRLYTRGSSLEVADLDGRRVALHICADSWIPEITDALYCMGARVIFSPCAWAIQPGGEECNIAWIRETYAARAKGKDLFIVSPNGVGKVTEGPWKGRILQGHSLVTGPGGKNLLQGPLSRPALLTLEL